MKAPRCPRLWEVEAARDARLDATALAACQRHMLRCAQCARERDLLDALARGLRAGTAVQDEVALRRMRQATLERAAAMLTHLLRVEGSLGPRSVLLAAGAALAVALAVAAFRLGHGAPQHRALVVMTPIAGTKWSRHHAQNLERIDLDDGALSVAVRRSPRDPRVVVRVPEGEIEDLGTVFKVTVRAGRTAEISVSQGVVVFRRPGKVDLRLSAGTLWTPSEETRAAIEAPTATPRSVVTTNPVVPSTQPLRAVRAQPRTLLKPALDVPATANLTAAPQDAAAEDGAYLQILALLREGRRDEARLDALAYLRKFPTGFRRIEVERIADGAAPR